MTYFRRKVGLLKVEGKRYTLEPLALRTVRPFVIDEIVLVEIAEEEGFEVTDQVEISRYLKTRVCVQSNLTRTQYSTDEPTAQVNQLIEKANREWDERNERAVEEGEEALERMLPLVRIKVDTTGVPAMSNPIRFGQEFAGKDCE